jgi:ATP-dependent RNA helicase RhlE
MESTIAAPSGFKTTGLLPVILSTLDKVGFTTPTPIQEQAIPIALTGQDLIGIAQTGTGKTMAFGLPILNYLLQHPQERALVIVPTRELALQVEESIRKVSDGLYFELCV